MAITSTDETRQTNDLVVSVRIPNGADGDLSTEAERRLLRADGVTDVTVEGLQGIEPRLSATVVTVAVTIERVTGLAADLDNATGVEIIDASRTVE